MGDGSRTLGCTITILAQPRIRVQTGARLWLLSGSCIDPADFRSVAQDREEDPTGSNFEAWVTRSIFRFAELWTGCLHHAPS